MILTDDVTHRCRVETQKEQKINIETRFILQKHRVAYDRWWPEIRWEIMSARSHIYGIYPGRVFFYFIYITIL